MTKSHKHNAEWEKPDTKAYAPYSSIHIEYEQRKPISAVKTQDSCYPWLGPRSPTPQGLEAHMERLLGHWNILFLELGAGYQVCSVYKNVFSWMLVMCTFPQQNVIYKQSWEQLEILPNTPSIAMHVRRFTPRPWPGMSFTGGFSCWRANAQSW